MVLSVDNDKTTENELLTAICAAGALLAEQHTHIHVLDFTSIADVLSVTPGDHVVFLGTHNHKPEYPTATSSAACVESLHVLKLTLPGWKIRSTLCTAKTGKYDRSYLSSSRS